MALAFSATCSNWSAGAADPGGLRVANRAADCCSLAPVRGEAEKQFESVERRGDPSVLSALALGWEMADLYIPPSPSPPRGHAPQSLPSESELSSRERVGLTAARLSGLLERALGPGAGQDTERVQRLREIGDGDPDGWRRAAYELHVDLLTRLQTGDPTLSRAYELGHSLAEISRDPTDLSALLDRLEPRQLLPVEAALADLSSRLPRHAAAAVGATLEQWHAWTSEARAREDLDAVRGALARQRALWRAVLCGEKDAREMLDPDTVMAASVRHATRLGTLIRGLTGAYLPALGALALSVILLLWAIVDQTGIATVIGALGALAATMVAIRKSLALTAQDTIDELRGSLWDAELDAAVAQSILRLPPTPAAERRPRLALGKLPAPALGPGERLTVRQRLERALHVTTAARQQGLHVPASGPATATPDEATTTEQPSANGTAPHSET